VSAQAIGTASSDQNSYVWMLRRNCSLSPRQFVFSLGLLAGGPLVVALLCAAAGAWPVLLFATAEALIVGVFCLLYVPHAIDFDRIELSEGCLAIVQRNGLRISRSELNPRWVRVKMEDGKYPQIEIRYAGTVTLIGRYVTIAYREHVVEEVNRKLRAVRAGT